MSKTLELQVLGKLVLRRDGAVLPMIRSKKTRSFLAYLAMTQTPHLREDLCNLFFDNTNDPRGALRWCLSRLRGILGPDAARLIADKDTVQFDAEQMHLDIDVVRRIHAMEKPDVSELIRAAELIPSGALAHLKVAEAEGFDDWLAMEQRTLDKIHSRIIRNLIALPSLNPEIAVKWLRQQVKFEPSSRQAAFALWQRLSDLNRQDDAAKVEAKFCRATGTKFGIFSQESESSPQKKFELEQKVGHCTSPDGVNIAYAQVGEGPPVVKAANWLNHLELDWESPIWGDTFQALAQGNTFIRYDERGNGLSDWDVADISFDAFVQDLETVVNHLGLERFPLLGMSQGCAVSIAYAVKHPERVSALILIGGYAAGWRIGMPPEEIERREAVSTLTRHGWGTSNPAYRQIFSQTFMPNADADRLAWFNEFQRQTTSPENAVRFHEAFGDIDVRDLLSKVRAPTLILHAADDQRIPLRHGQELADSIPNARMVTLESCNHIILGDEPAWNVLMREIHTFLAKH